MNRMVFLTTLVFFGLSLRLPAGVGVKNAGRTSLEMEIGTGQQEIQQAPPKAFHCPQKEGSRVTCPISDQVFTITKDTPRSEFTCCGIYVYYCCEKCKTEFLKSPRKYLGDEMKPPNAFYCPQNEGYEATCPVSGEAFNITKDTLHSEYHGKYVYFCCAGANRFSTKTRRNT